MYNIKCIDIGSSRYAFLSQQLQSGGSDTNLIVNVVIKLYMYIWVVVFHNGTKWVFD